MKSANIIIYQKPTCTTCRQVYAVLKESGVDFKSVNYFIDPISKTTLKRLLKKLGIAARALLRSKEAKYKEMNLGEKDLTERQLIELMVRHPELLQRPIIEKGERAILARPAERVKELL